MLNLLSTHYGPQELNIKIYQNVFAWRVVSIPLESKSNARIGQKSDELSEIGARKEN